MSKQLRDEQDQLVQKAEALVHQLKDLGGWNQDIGRTQASRAIEVARAADSLRLFINWLRYQAARESDRQRFWSLKLNQATLAETLSKALNDLPAGEDGPMPQARLLLGYFRRALVGAEFLNKIKVEG